ncbi:uncharacterized protein MYCGRDRAFT_95665 [Zymoseptoria tritici IPO323]|uniref:Uncharacterized protein n=1 Tax=Zymoseptoria tritici (strain CBS 115943 / IPO323) TaxID=336722 RepID=F9XJV8_ZYMTI|nr:uncharacterized protein MYCGRDRAFT_95665 [Zymoseptoria tritici IPO323]EGP84729.1 hypothetical protein MYCGRDRAFT_95665 [Zymoseptoria tritici IPO323]
MQINLIFLTSLAALLLPGQVLADSCQLEQCPLTAQCTCTRPHKGPSQAGPSLWHGRCGQDRSSIPTGGVESQKKDGGGIAAEVLSVGRRSGRETETVGMGEG